MNDQKPKSHNNKWLALINIPIQMGVIIFAFAYFGNWLDENNSNASFLYIIIFIMIYINILYYNVNCQLKEINKLE
jgi:hypothetical protein